MDPLQGLLFPEGTVAEPAVAAATPGGGWRRCCPRGRRPLLGHLRREKHVHELTEAERLCPCCGRLRAAIGEEVSELLEYQPASLYVVRHIRLKYACPSCPGAAVTREVVGVTFTPA